MAVKFKSSININDQYTFPSVVGTDGQYLSVTDAAAGTLDWTDIGDIDGLKSNFVYYDAKNSTGSTIPIGTAVMAVGSDGNSGHVLIAPMVADGSIEPKYFIGVADDNISNGQIGKVVHFGIIDKVNTNAFSDGDILWCDPSNPGGFTTTEPQAPASKIASAIVINSSTNGKLLVRVQGNEGLHELHDVHIEDVTDGQALVWDSTQGYWKNDDVVNSVTAGTGISVDESNGDITITNTSPDQTVSLTSGTGISTSGTYPDFTITNSSPDQTVSLTAGTGISTSGTYPDFTITNNAPDQTVSISGTGAATVTGTYPNFTIDVEESTGGASASTLVVEKNEYTGNGSTVAFALSSPIQAESQTQVYIDGVYQSKNNYSTSGNTITFSTAPDAGTDIEVIHLLSVSAVVKTDAFTGNGSTSEYTLSQILSSENNTQVYFDGVYQSKSTYSVLDNVITFSENVPSGVEIEVVHLKAVDISALNSSLITGDGTTTDFTLPQAVDSKDKTFVFLQGVYQEKSTYSISGTTISFNTAPQDGYTLEVITFASVSVEGGSGIQKGTTAERPESPDEGLTRYNTDTKKLELYNGVGWFNIGPEYSFTADATSLTVDSNRVRVDSTTF
jgi:hypothetical protein